MGIFLTNQEVVNTGDYGTNIIPPGGSLNLSANAASNLLFDPAVTNAPPLSGGRWYYDITNESGMEMTNIRVVITISGSLTPNLTLTEYNNTPTPLGTDDHTLSQICVDQRGSGQQPATGVVAGGGAPHQYQRGQPGVASDQPARAPACSFSKTGAARWSPTWA